MPLTNRHKLQWMALAASLLLLISLLLFRWWQGPLLPGYRLTPTTLVQNVVATGHIVSTSRAQVGSEITGVVMERRVREGDRVAAGDVLLVLRADDLSARVREARAAIAQFRSARRPQAQARLRQTETQLELARRDAERNATLQNTGAISREAKERADQALATAVAAAEQARLEAASLAPGQSEEIILKERLAAAEAALSKTFVRAQFPGTVLTRSVEPGDLVQPGRVLLEIAREGVTEVLVPVDERNLGVLKLGQTATCVADAYPDRPFSATVNFISPSIDAQRGTVAVRLLVDPAPAFLRNDLTITVSIETGRRDQALAIPNDALFTVKGRQASALVLDEGRLRRADLTLGLEGLAMTEVSSGLKAGDWVVTDPAAKEGQRVRIAPKAIPVAADKRATSKETPMKFN